MASLRRFPRSPFWYACFTLPDGRRVQRSTSETRRKKAQKQADDWERLSKERAKARQAHQVIAEIYRSAHGEDLPDATARAFIEGYLKRREGELAPASYRAYRGRARHFLNWLGEKADRPLGEIDTPIVAAYRDAVASERTASTANHGVKILRTILDDARRSGYVAENAAKDCRTLRKESGASRRPLTVAEIRKILTVAADEWRSLVVFGLYSGQRLGDLARLTWANIDTAAKEVHLTTRKTGRVVRIPICEPLLSHIASLPVGDNPAAPIHPKAAALAETNVSTLSRQFADLLASVGLASPRSHKAEKEGRAVKRAKSEVSFHSLRHSAVSLMKNAGISPAVVQDLVGHDSAEMSAHYTRIESDAKREALKALPDVLS